MSPTDFDRRFGNLALDKGFVTIEQLLSAISFQIREEMFSGIRKEIGTVLYERGRITKSQMEAILKELLPEHPE